MHSYALGNILPVFSFLLVLGVMTVWWRDVTREGSY
jgi:hypothetical protein